MLRKKAVVDAVQALLTTHSHERAVFDEIAGYLRPWTGEEAARRVHVEVDSKNRDRHAELARMSQSPFIGLVLDTYGQSLKVDGFFTGERGLADSWKWWKRNGMARKQTGLHRACLAYGSAYCSVLPAAGGGAKINVHSPRRMVAYFGDSTGFPGMEATSDEFPVLALEVDTRRHVLRLWDEECVYFIGARYYPNEVSGWRDGGFNTSSNFELVEAREHGVGVTPIVRYRDRWMADGEEQHGIVEHLLGLQDRINTTNYEQGVTQAAAAFKQRYIIGWLPKDRSEALRQDVATTQFFKDTDVKVGQYQESDLTRYIESRQATVRDFAAVAQVPAQSLGANAISNISADGLAALETSKDRKAAEIQTCLGDSHEQLLRLCAYITGDEVGAADFESEVNWEETSARSFAQTVDGLGKLATMLGIPPQELWSDIPGWTRERVERARKAQGAMPNDWLLADEDVSVPAEEVPAGEGAQGAVDKATWDSLGVAIRAGVDPEDAARRLGLGGLKFTGDKPVSLRSPEE